MILHVACLPFPTYQGTQAAVAAMLNASASARQPVELLTYAHAAYEPDVPYEIHRIPDLPRVRSERSGPSWGKLALDARGVAEIRRLARTRQPVAIVAHHIEAALASLAARVAPVYYVAHTSLEHELPVYLPRLAAPIVRAIARSTERKVCERAAGVAAVAPSLAALLGDGVQYLPVPWPPCAAANRPSRAQSRAELGLPTEAQVCLYAGNLDRYQGWEYLIEAAAILRRSEPNARLLLATASNPAPARKLAQGLGIADAVQFAGLDTEHARVLAHAASDLVWVPRRSEGGLPIKMLDAFAREVPVVAMKRATAGLSLQRACCMVPDDDPRALAAAAAILFKDERARDALRDGARRYLSVHHSNEWFSTAMRSLLGETCAHRAGALSTYGPSRLLLDPD